jgi:hypothetical protein
VAVIREETRVMGGTSLVGTYENRLDGFYRGFWGKVDGFHGVVRLIKEGS